MGKSVTALIERFEEEAASDQPTELTPDIGIVMGSDSDLRVMEAAHDALTSAGFVEQTMFHDPPAERFTFETYVISAHRTPDLMYAYAENAASRGLDVLIAGAGGKSADLPNMVASIAFPIPVIGVPVDEKSVDSVIGMPTGAPIVAVDAGKAYNAALSAIQMLSLKHPELSKNLTEYHSQLRDEVGTVSKELHDTGTNGFLADR